MSQGSFNPKIRFLGQKVCSVARLQTHIQTDRHTRKWLLRAPFQGFRSFAFNLSSRIGPTRKMPLESVKIKKIRLCHVLMISHSLSKVGTNKKGGIPSYLNHGTGFMSGCAYGWQPQSEHGSCGCSGGIGKTDQWSVGSLVSPCAFQQLALWIIFHVWKHLVWHGSVRMLCPEQARTSQDSGAMWHFLSATLSVSL